MFVAGGKWTTWREMAQDAVDRITDVKCTTKEFGLHGAKGYHKNLPIRLVQAYGIHIDVAKHLAKTYGGKAFEVAELGQFKQLDEFYPYIEAEVIYACRVEFAQTVEDILSRRTRIAFLNKSVALGIADRVGEIMQKELNWSADETKSQVADAVEYVSNGFGGPDPVKSGAKLRNATFRDVIEIFNAMDVDKSGGLGKAEIGQAADMLGFSLTEEGLDEAIKKMDTDGNGRVDLEEFENWWNNDEDNSEIHKKFHDNIKLGSETIEEIKQLGTGTMLG